jgi:hypothetical protein
MLHLERACAAQAQYVEFAREEVEAARGGELVGGPIARQAPGGTPDDGAKAQALDALQARPRV